MFVKTSPKDLLAGQLAICYFGAKLLTISLWVAVSTQPTCLQVEAFSPLPTAPIANDGSSMGGSPNSIEQHSIANTNWQQIPCGTISTNSTNMLVKNPHYPEATYTKVICETVIERANPSITKLNINLKQLELYRPTSEGKCTHDRFAIYTDLNVPVSEVLCGNHDGKTLSVPFHPNQHNLILSVSTSELDHDRFWLIELEQVK